MEGKESEFSCESIGSVPDSIYTYGEFWLINLVISSSSACYSVYCLGSYKERSLIIAGGTVNDTRPILLYTYEILEPG